MKMKKLYDFTVTYFKPSGKLYVKDYWQFECDICGEETCYMQDAVDQFILMQDSGAKLPGLSGSWNSYIMLDCSYGYPCLIVPKYIEGF